MAKVINTRPGDLILPPTHRGHGGQTLRHGVNDIADDYLDACAKHPTVKTWLKLGHLVVPSNPTDEKTVEAPASVDESDDESSLDESDDPSNPTDEKTEKKSRRKGR